MTSRKKSNRSVARAAVMASSNRFSRVALMSSAVGRFIGVSDCRVAFSIALSR